MKEDDENPYEHEMRLHGTIGEGDKFRAEAWNQGRQYEKDNPSPTDDVNPYHEHGKACSQGGVCEFCAYEIGRKHERAYPSPQTIKKIVDEFRNALKRAILFQRRFTRFKLTTLENDGGQLFRIITTLTERRRTKMPHDFAHELADQPLECFGKMMPTAASGLDPTTHFANCRDDCECYTECLYEWVSKNPPPKTVKKIQSEAVDNFAEKVKEKIHKSEDITHTAPPRIPVCVVVRIIDNALKEKEGEE